MNSEHRALMASVVAAGVVRIDSSKHQDPANVARISLGITDEICRQIDTAEQLDAMAKSEPAEAA